MRPPDAIRPGNAPGRIRARRDFLAANQGRRVACAGFVLLVRPRADADAAMRAGFTVTKRIGNAVTRNRLKRRLREVARHVLPGHGVPGADHVLIGRDAGLARAFALLCTDLEQALARARRAVAQPALQATPQ
jgi:ribonuclease P protein component